jgi:phosphoglycerate dehydrogenase-like enzyme
VPSGSHLFLTTNHGRKSDLGKIVAVHSLESRHISLIQEAAPGWTIIDGSDRLAAQEHLHDAEIILGWNKLVDELAVSDTSKLKWLQNWGAGVDRLPLERFQQLGITLTSASGVHPYPISETIFAMLLGFTRHLHIAIRNQSGGKWVNSGMMDEAHGRTIGILGVGAIGSETARLAKAFNMKVVGLRRSGRPEEWVDTMYDNAGLNEMLSNCDYVVNCLPYTHETEHLMGEEQFAAMKTTAFYINIGRGKTTDTGALVEALQSRGIAGAGLDVFETEPLPADHPLWRMDNVIMTPHNAGSTLFYTERVIEIFVHNLKKFVHGYAPDVSVVDLGSEY